MWLRDDQLAASTCHTGSTISEPCLERDCRLAVVTACVAQQAKLEEGGDKVKTGQDDWNPVSWLLGVLLDCVLVLVFFCFVILMFGLGSEILWRRAYEG